jgi:hypothetical protein
MSAESPQPFLVKKAMSLWPQSRHVLKVVQGCAWVTLVGKPGQENPDIFLYAGEDLSVEAGQHLVLESWTGRVQDALWVEWQIAYDAFVDSSKEQGIACPQLSPNLSPVKTT